MLDATGKTNADTLLGDDPMADEGHDLLRRGDFAGRVAQLADHVSTQTPSAVMALLGPWGSGKTSVLHFVRQRLESRPEWRTVEFNPWMVSDLPSLVQEFFTTLIAALPEDQPDNQLREKMAGYARAVSPFAASFTLLGFNVGQAARAAGDTLAGDESIEAQRTELEKALRAHNNPILLIADDLDRLHPDELTLVFKLVRLVGRLPNVYYLLAFDEETVIDVLTSTEITGRDRSRALAYLEKMVQVRLDLPPVHPRLLGQLLDQFLEALTARHGILLDDKASRRLGRAYQTHLASYLREPRQVKRYCAQIEALYPLVASEVDFVDFALITFLRTFHPGIVNVLTAHKQELTGTEIELVEKPTHEQRRERWRDRLKKTDVAAADIDGALELLGELFLPVRSALKRMEHGSHAYEELAAGRRVGSSEYFDRYFHLGIGPDDVPDATVSAAIAEVVERAPGQAWSAVVDMLSINAELVLDKLRRFTPATAAAPLGLLPVLAAIETRIPYSGLFGRARLVYEFWTADLLLAAEPTDPAAFVEELAEASGVCFLADTCSRAKQTAEEDGPTTAASFDDVSAEIVRLIKEDLNRQAQVAPADTSGVLGLLADLQTLEPGVDHQGWMRSVVESGAWPLPEALGIFVSTQRIFIGGGLGPPALAGTQLDFLDQLLGIQYVADHLEALLDPSEEPPSDERDVSWEARVRRAKWEVARAIASRSPKPSGATKSDHPG